MRPKRENYRNTILACYVGYVTQAVVNNFAPLLFLTFRADFGLTLDQIALAVSVNFAVQLVVDLLSARFVDRIGYRACIVAAHVFAAAGLAGLGILPGLLGAPFAGILVSVVLYAVGGGLVEVLVSPILEACPTERKEAAMSLLHSFYCWGQMAVIVFSTVFFLTAGIRYWRVLACLWALVPLSNAVFFLTVPIRRLTAEGESMGIRALFRSGSFWILVVLMLCAGAAELSMSQWASAFAEAGLGVSKTLGDLLGPCAFAALMGAARVLQSKIRSQVRFFVISCALSAAGYLLASLTASPVLGLAGCAMCGFACGAFWPGTLSMASRRFPAGGTAMFSFLALAGDLGCSAGPGIVGLVSGAAGDDLRKGLLTAACFPAVLLAALMLLRREKGRE